VWGCAHELYQASVLVAIPLGELTGQILVFFGLALATYYRPSWHEGFAIVAGLFVFSAFHGGVAVVQHTVLARVLPNGLTIAFVAVVIGTHISSALCNALVPSILDFGGLLWLQGSLLLPSLLVSVPAGCMLALQSRAPNGFANRILDKSGLFSIEAGRWLTVDPRNGSFSESLLDRCASQDGCCDRTAFSEGRVVLLSIWRALVLSLGHAFQSVMNALLVSIGLSETDAGMRIARSQTIALLLLPAVGLVAERWGCRRLLVLTSLFALAAVLALSYNALLTQAGIDAALLGWSLAQVVAPVLALALVPANSPRRRYSRSFGILEALGSLAQVVFLLLIGSLRQAGGFDSVLRLLCLGIGCSVLLSLALLSVLDDHRAKQQLGMA